MSSIRFRRAAILAGTALAATAFSAAPALAQDAGTDTPAAAPADTGGGLQEIIVTAQKREQNLLTVPIAVTAVTADTLQANRVTNVVDLSSLAPGVTVRQTLGGGGIPFFSLRGIQSNTVAPGADREMSLNIDGVYLSAFRGSIFNFPDAERIEVLRGPQGTLFGRNSTTGAVSVYTRDPDGNPGVKAMLSEGNRALHRFQLTADTPQMGPFSAYFTFVHEEQRGATRNALGGQTYYMNNSAIGPKSFTSADWLGSTNHDTYFAALKFEPSDDFKMVYKFDHSNSSDTNDAVGLVALSQTQAGSYAGIWNALLATGYTTPIVPNYPQTSRPSVAYNGYNSPLVQSTEGHNLTANWKVNDHVSFKNIAAYRTSSIFSTANVDALTGLTFTQDVANAVTAAFGAAYGPYYNSLVGGRWITYGNESRFDGKQWSDELQLNYDSDLMTLTLGGLYFKSKEYTNQHAYANSISFTPVVNGVLPQKPGISYDTTESLAAYGQAEVHVTPQVDLVLGGRLTRDKKMDQFSYGNIANLTVLSSTYKKSKFTYLLGVNYRPAQDMLLYAKYSTGYVSGGTVGPVAYPPETVRSAEAGFKGELLDRHLRVSLSAWWAKYKNAQAVFSATNLGSILTDYFSANKIDPNIASVIGTFIFPRGDVLAKGIEAEVTAAPVRGLTLGGNASYTDSKSENVPDFAKKAVYLPTTAPDSDYKPVEVPKWTLNLFGQYDSQPVFGDAFVSARIDAIYNDKVYTYQNQTFTDPAYKSALTIPSYWVVNGRLALKDIKLGSGVNTELALWGKNIFNTSKIAYAIFFVGQVDATYTEPRSYGMDLTLKF